MQIATPLISTSQNDPQAEKQWAAEDFAFRSACCASVHTTVSPISLPAPAYSNEAFAAGLIDPLDPAVQIFKGDTDQLLAAVERVIRDYGDRCVFCAASDQEEEFD